MQISLYIHFPFCLKKCLYCDFNSLAGSTITPSQYAAAVIREMELRAERLDGPLSSETLYFGGGTPSLMEPKEVTSIVEAARNFFSLAGDAEITIEANPGTLSPEKLAGFRNAGINRLSLGVQSFNDENLGSLGRIHTARQALDAFAAAREAGFANIGIDLIHSLPGQDLAAWQEDLSLAVQLRPEHISAYALSVEEGTPFQTMKEEGKLLLPDEDEELAMFRHTSSYLKDHGYDHYEISNFSLPGFRSRHNQVYWHRSSYLGFGAGAHSFLRTTKYGIRWHNVPSPEDHMESIIQSRIPEEDLAVLTKREAMAEFMFLGLRMLEGVAVEQFHHQFGLSFQEAYPEELLKLLSERLLESSGGIISLSERGLLMANQVFMRFV